jgi:alpha-N-arabinofuranosidase
MLVHGERFIPLVDGIATTDKNRTKWVLALINRHPENQVTCSIALHGEKPDGIFDAKVLKGDSPDAYNDKDHPNRVVPEKVSLRIKDGGITLAPHSLTIVAVPRGDHEN